MSSVVDTQLNAQELEKVITCISVEIDMLNFQYGTSKPRLRQQILYSARDKLLKQQKLLKEDHYNGNK